MKANILILVALFFMAATYTETQKPNMALVEKVNGIYIFVYSAPVCQYESLGTFENGFMLANFKTSTVLDHMTKRAKERYTNCNALIFTDKDLLKATAVKINE